MITLKKVQLKNFLSHSDTELDFKEHEKLLIDGHSGSGKSSIVDAIIWCLYGTGRSDNKSMIKKSASKMEVKVTLNDGEIDYRVDRSINNKGKHEFAIYEIVGKKISPVKVTGIKGMQDFLEKKILKSSYLLFINSIVYPQDNVENFVKQTAAKRKEILLEIINAESFDEFLDKAKDEIQRIKSQLAICRLQIDERKTRISGEDDMKVEIKSLEAESKRLEDELNWNKEKQSRLQTDIVGQSKDQSRIEDLKLKYQDLEYRKRKLVMSIQDITNRIEFIEKSIKETDEEKLRQQISALPEKQEELRVLEGANALFLEWSKKMNDILSSAPAQYDFSDIPETNKKIIELMKEEIEICPELGKSCPLLKQKNEDAIKCLSSQLDARNGLKRLQDERNKANVESIEALGPKPEIDFIKIAGLKEEIKYLVDTKDRLLEINSKRENLETLKVLAKQYSSEFLQIQKESKEIDELYPDGIESALDVLNKVGILAKEQLRKIETDIAVIEKSYLDVKSKLMMLEKEVEFLIRVKEEVKVFLKEEKEMADGLDNLALVKDAFGSNGIKAIMIDYVIPRLEDSINSILEKLSDFRIRLDTQKSGAGKDTVLEGLFITIYNELGEELDFDSYSGGEKLKITVAISEALAEIQKVGFRILDELFIGLDEESTEKFADVMTALQERFGQMICISHLRNIKDLFEEKITVSKVNGNSVILR